jgi:hypothetical protein
LVAEPVAEAEVVTTPDPQLSTPPSDETLEVTPPDLAGDEPPETEPEASRQPDSYDLNELDQLYLEGKLADPSLVTRREGLRQVENDRQREQQRVLAEYTAQEEARANQLASLGTETRTAIQQAISRELTAAMERGRDPDMELIQERVEGIIANLEGMTQAIHLTPHERGMRQLVARVSGLPDTPQNRRALEALSLPELTGKLYEAAYRNGQQAGPGEDAKVTPSKDWKPVGDSKDSYHTASYQKGIDDMKALNPSWKTLATDNVRNSGSGPPTWAQVQKMSPAQLNALSDDDYRAAKARI